MRHPVPKLIEVILIVVGEGHRKSPAEVHIVDSGDLLGEGEQAIKRREVVLWSFDIGSDVTVETGDRLPEIGAQVDDLTVIDPEARTFRPRAT